MVSSISIAQKLEGTIYMGPLVGQISKFLPKVTPNIGKKLRIIPFVPFNNTK